MRAGVRGATLGARGPRTVKWDRRRPVRHALRIAVLCPLWFPVPPPLYGGIEAVVALLAEGLDAAGHEVTVFAAGDSGTDARLSWVYGKAPSERIGEPLPELRHVLACFERAEEFDVISDHTGPLAAALGQLVTTPVLQCMARSMGSSVRRTSRLRVSRLG
jgi:glycosyltransferase involved in cell wall biosynthesis